MYSYGSLHTAAQKQDDQHERTFSSCVRIQDVVLKTCLGRWTIGRSGERGSGISVLPARYDDDDTNTLIIKTLLCATYLVIIYLSDWLILTLSSSVGLFYAKQFGNRIPCTFVFTFFINWFLRIFCIRSYWIRIISKPIYIPNSVSDKLGEMTISVYFPLHKIHELDFYPHM